VIGVDNILVETDYPHADSTWPDTQPLLRRHLAGVPAAEVAKMCWQNATKLFRLPTPPDAFP
jgi:Tat protein secretion system quality control protein TatD with DNase activity